MKWRFDTTRIADRRQHVGYPVATLAAHLGVSTATLRAIEGGSDPGIYDLRLLVRLAEALGMGLLDLFADDEPSAPPTDVATVVAALVTAEGPCPLDVVARELNWSPQRTRLALEAAEKQLETVGLALSWQADVAVRLVASHRLDQATIDVSRAFVEEHGLRRNTARLLVELHRLGSKGATRDSSAIRMLTDAGLTEFRVPQSERGKAKAPTLHLTGTARFNLCLDEAET